MGKKQMEKKSESGMSRRRFLNLGIGATGSAIALGYIGSAGKFLEPPVANAETLKEVGKVFDFEEGVPKFITYKGSTVDEGIYIVNMGKEGWLALEFLCTHLQCAVSYDDASKQFLCPCHGGAFDMKGNVLYGPIPKPLQRRVIEAHGISVRVGGRLD
ncbi:ubiquinol-cytochrome c reductase iron-sulfur subunit [Bacillus sp. DNRA2]|uniref:QcrA and Rieske domain-containing protein n=1 Tax=Bacillus sp. DNRA2 TaxID=2723053 RepID=UPI00145EA787|nr:ubiquinol-cytochrome c reductase iron-sulfur subunit [Bacillus sp. DNRA2]NMD72406.1 ubiquinol-cytochrome c reductase iron-sulfur subunit [Bacillus sp. DNRA2]